MCPGSQIIEVNCLLKEAATHLPILYADRGEFDRKRFSPPIADADTPGDFFSPIAAMLDFNLVRGLHRGAF